MAYQTVRPYANRQYGKGYWRLMQKNSKCWETQQIAKYLELPYTTSVHRTITPGAELFKCPLCGQVLDNCRLEGHLQTCQQVRAPNSRSPSDTWKCTYKEAQMIAHTFGVQSKAPLTTSSSYSPAFKSDGDYRTIREDLNKIGFDVEALASIQAQLFQLPHTQDQSECHYSLAIADTKPSLWRPAIHHSQPSLWQLTHQQEPESRPSPQDSERRRMSYPTSTQEQEQEEPLNELSNELVLQEHNITHNVAWTEDQQQSSSDSADFSLTASVNFEPDDISGGAEVVPILPHPPPHQETRPGGGDSTELVAIKMSRVGAITSDSFVANLERLPQALLEESVRIVM